MCCEHIYFLFETITIVLRILRGTKQGLWRHIRRLGQVPLPYHRVLDKRFQWSFGDTTNLEMLSYSFSLDWVISGGFLNWQVSRILGVSSSTNDSTKNFLKSQNVNTWNTCNFQGRKGQLLLLAFEPKQMNSFMLLSHTAVQAKFQYSR